MAKYLTKEGLGNILNTVVGMKPKTLPARLEKNDIVIHQNRLYKYKGDPKQVSLVSESEFKKAGLRFMGEDYKVVLLNDILELYKWMYQSGLNGHKLGDDWGERPDFYYVRSKNTGESPLYRTYYMTTLRESKLKDNFIFNYYKLNKFSDIFNFPIKLTLYESRGEDIILNSIEEEEKVMNNKNNRYKTFSIHQLFRDNTINDNGKFGSKLKEEYLKIYENFNEFEKFQKVLKENENKMTFFPVEKIRPSTYEIPMISLKFVNKNGFKIKTEDDRFVFGVYQKYMKVSNKIKTWENFKNGLFTTEREDFNTSEDHGSDYQTMLIAKDILPKWYERERFFLPYFMDIIANDSANNTAKELNEEHNKYGVFIQGKEDGEYTLSFKVCMSTRDQHEEYTNGTEGWGDQYAFSPTRNTVRQENLTYVMWKKNDLISFELNWKVENGTAKDWKLKLLDENKRNTQGLDNFMKWIQVETSENYLFLQLFYAVYSCDDSGSWNEWQFAHILPPFNLEFKGE